MHCFIQLQEDTLRRGVLIPTTINLDSISRIRPLDENTTIITFQSTHSISNDMMFRVNYDELMEYISGFQEVKMIKIQQP